MAANRIFIRTHDGSISFTTDASTVIHSAILSNYKDRSSNASYVALLVNCWVSLLADSPISTNDRPAGGKPKKLFRAFYQDLLDSTLEDTTDRFASLAERLLTSATLYGEGSITGPFIDDMKSTPVFREYLEWYRNGDARCLRFVLSFLLFGKKAELQNPELEPEALRQWLDVEEGLHQLSLPSETLDDLAYLLDILLPPLPVLPFMGKNGPGTIAGGGRAVSTKLKQLTYDALIDRAFFLSVGHTTRQQRLAFDPVHVIPNWEAWKGARQQKMKRNLRPAELLFVPKTNKSMRSICREPAVMMYFQQAVRYALEDTINTGFLSRFIDIRDQTRNQQACLAGSIGGMIDTIDLSAASDSVSIDLVREIFPRHLLILLLATRSTRVKIHENGVSQVVNIKKFAPMGSAVCFPVQCIVYTVVCILEYLRCELGKEWRDSITSTEDLSKFFHRFVYSEANSNFGKLQPIFVYGDDILCDTSVTQNIIHTLETLGFRVNQEKSFQSSQAVRESCGLYAWNGEDITPLRFKVAHFERSMSMRSCAAIIDMANRAGDENYRHLQRCLIHMVLRYPLTGVSKSDREDRLNPIRFVAKREEFGIFTKRPEETRNLHLRKRIYQGQVDETTCSRYQRDEVKCIGVYIETKKDDTASRHRFEYTQWWRAAYHGGVSTDTYVRSSWYDAIVRGAEIRWGWTPA